MTGSLQIPLVLFFIFSHYTFHESGGKFHKAIKHLLHDNSKSSLRNRRLSNIGRAVPFAFPNTARPAYITQAPSTQATVNLLGHIGFSPVHINPDKFVNV